MKGPIMKVNLSVKLVITRMNLMPPFSTEEMINPILSA